MLKASTDHWDVGQIDYIIGELIGLVMKENPQFDPVKVHQAIIEELEKRGIKFPKNFNGVGDSYAGFITLCEETEPKLLDFIRELIR